MEYWEMGTFGNTTLSKASIDTAYVPHWRHTDLFKTLRRRIELMSLSDNESQGLRRGAAACPRGSAGAVYPDGRLYNKRHRSYILREGYSACSELMLRRNDSASIIMSGHPWGIRSC